jgi:hypothetical protein
VGPGDAFSVHQVAGDQGHLRVGLRLDEPVLFRVLELREHHRRGKMENNKFSWGARERMPINKRESISQAKKARRLLLKIELLGRQQLRDEVRKT